MLRYSEGTDTMKKIASSIRAGANAYLKHQYTTVAKVFVVVFVILLVIAFASNGSMLSKFTPFAFVTGGIWSMLAGFIGMRIATNSNARTAQAASESLNKGLRVAFSSGSVMGFTVVGLGMLDITIWFFLLRYAFGINDPVHLGNIMVMNGMGASFMALFARVGGGIYTKAADVGADLVGKVEANIPEDDPRNPATIADNVGDNVGDVAGMGADLYESYGLYPFSPPSRWAPWAATAGADCCCQWRWRCAASCAPSWAPSSSRRGKMLPSRPCSRVSGPVPTPRPFSAVLAASPHLFHLGRAYGRVCVHPLRPDRRLCHRLLYRVLYLRHLSSPLRSWRRPPRPVLPPLSSADCPWDSSPP